MKAAVLTAYDQFELIELPDPELHTSTDVIVRIAGAGVCGSDLHLAKGALEEFVGPLEFPFVLGHENGGHVEAVGDAVDTVGVGDPVLLHPHVTCGLCRACRRGAETYCERLRFPGVDGSSGGYAEYIRTDVRSVIRLPQGSDPAPLAALTDAGLTAYHAVRKTLAGLPPDGTAAVIGVGGVGGYVLQLLRIFSPARLIALDTDAARLEGARELGADETVLAGDGAVERIVQAADGRGADLVIDCVGVAGSPDSGLAALGRGGKLCVVGAGDGEICCGAVPITGREVSFEGSLVGTLGELTELVEIALRERIQVLCTYYSLADVEQAVEDLRRGRIEGRAVLRP